ncbi:MAG: DUF6261 family protein [Tannerella sp.]|jgi:hypothetical protein|nr:DUF6261 family protein [Tannerella sp.]
METENILTRVDFSHMRNEQHVTYFEMADALFVKYPTGVPALVSHYDAFKTNYGVEVSLLDTILNSPYTKKIEQADHERDEIFGGLNAFVQSFERHFDSNLRDAAAVIRRILKQYGNIARKALDQETAAIDDLLRELRDGNTPTAVQQLGLEPWMERLETANNHFKTLMLDRNAETAQRSATRMKDARKAVDRSFIQLIIQLEATVRVNGREPFEALIDELNAHTLRYKNILAQEAGARKAKKGGEEV